MPLASGQKLGAYEVVGAIGAGGMGEVYRARDPNLDREVAIKVLPEAFAADGERVARFEREAKLLAALNHPGIATVHGFEDAEGKRFLVMEHVEGETLAERVARGAIPIEEALPLFHQIAEALEAAHEKGVVHRDLKPLNIKITPEEKIKVLDFGLAKLAEAEPATAGEGGSQSPTLLKGTLHGVILGTASYMSPEQARGMLVDRRTDIWAFGCCLYEALTGKKAFEGESVTDVLAAVVKSEPDWSRLPKDIPWRIRDLLGRCLRKDPSKRLRDISAARLDIEDGTAPPVLAEGAKRGWMWVFAAALLGILVGAVLWRNPAPRPLPVQRFAVQVPIDFPAINNLAVSPDGNVLVFSGRDGQLGIRRFDDLETRFIEGTKAARRPFFSPDGRWVGFFAGAELKKVSLSGGPPVSVAHTRTPWRATWSKDGAIYVPSVGSILRVPDSGGKEDVVLRDSLSTFLWAHALPDGRSLLVASLSGGATRIEVVTVATGERKVIVNDAMAPHYVPTGHIVFARAGSLFAIPFNLASLAITGEAVPVIQGVRGVGSTGADYDVSLSGSLVYKPVADGKNRLVWVERSGTATPVIESEPGSPFLPHPRLSPDGRRVAVPVGGARGSLDLWLLEIARGTLRRVTFEGINTRPLWSPDGNELIFASSQGGGGYSVFTTQADGSGTAVRHTNGPHRIPTSVNSDGQVLVFRQAGEGWDIGMVRLDKASEPQMLLASPFNEHSGVLSPDDRWMAYVSDESGRDEVYVTSFPDMGRKDQVSTEGGTEPLWSRDSKELYYRDGDQMMAVSVQMKPDLVFGRPAVLFAGPYEMSTDNISANYDVAVDGRFLMMEDASGGASATVNVVLNWFEELRRLSPQN